MIKENTDNSVTAYYKRILQIKLMVLFKGQVDNKSPYPNPKKSLNIIH